MRLFSVTLGWLGYRVPRLAVVAPGSAALRQREFCVTRTRAIKPVCVRVTHRGV